MANPEVQTRDEEFEMITTQGVGADYNKEWLVEYDPMIQAFKHFFETGKLDDALIWEDLAHRVLKNEKIVPMCLKVMSTIHQG